MGPMSAPNGDRTIVNTPDVKTAGKNREAQRKAGKLRTGKTK